VGLKLDLEAGTLKVWLNGNLNEKKQVGITGAKIAPGNWVPVATLSGVGNQIVINPFAQDPEGLLDSIVDIP
jgi:hypothetical protein